jgi:NAD(P)-dependent dehydrogenase (short-subunit alcohol dehydrogenase family)
MSPAGGVSFEDRWIIVSGASSGIGRAISLQLVAQGARVVLMGRNADRLIETGRLAGAADRTHVCQLDLSDLHGIAPAVRGLVEKTGRIYGLCHSAGQLQMLPLSATRPDRVRTMMDVNFGAGLELCRALVERSVMTEAGASILWISSIAAHVGSPGQIAYCASKGALRAAMRAMAVELAPRRVRVNSVSPGMVMTEMAAATGARLTDEQMARIEALHPLGLGQPQDIARAASFLLDPLNVWVTGTDLVIDGGYSLQ